MSIEQETDRIEKIDMGKEQETDRVEKIDISIEQEDTDKIGEDGDSVDWESRLEDGDGIERKSQLEAGDGIDQESQCEDDEDVKDSEKGQEDIAYKTSVNSNIKKKVQAGREKKTRSLKRKASDAKRRAADVKSTAAVQADNVEKAQEWNRDAERARRREQRCRQVRMYKICILAVIILIVCGVAGAFVWNIPSLKLSRKMAAGDRYTAGGDYEMAQKSYEEALKIDSGTVEAYRCLAQNHDEQDDSTAAKEILYSGWENTQDESLLKYYCTIILNEAVAQINEKECSLETVDKCIQVLKLMPDNEDALSLLETCYERLYAGSDENNKFDGLMSGSVADNSQYKDYEQELRIILGLYRDTDSKEIGNLLTKYAIIDTEYVYLDVNYLTDYNKLLEDINAAVPDKNIEELADCLADAVKVQEDFADIFTEFAQGNYESAKEFIVSDTYVQLRDSFIDGENKYWEGASAIPINQEKMAIHKTKEGFKFFWLDYDDYDNSQGVITVWGSRQLDDGVQRTTISYEPAGKNGEYYPHMEYVISYEYSNVLKNGTDVKMNYRFNTITTTEEGTETEAVGDWGGEDEWRTSY